LDGKGFQNFATTSCNSASKFITKEDLLEMRQAESGRFSKVKRRAIEMKCMHSRGVK
jgi:hypothetical protein